MFELILWSFIAYAIFVMIKRKIAKPNYENKTVWITGASSGLGQYLSYEFSKRGANLIISARNQKQLQRVKKSCTNPDKVTVVPMDMIKYEQVQQKTKKIIESLQASGNKLDVVVENAGISMRCPFRDYAFKNNVDLFDLNVHGPYNHIQCFIQHMIKNKTGQIVGITSLAGKMPTAYRSSYSGSKAAFIAILDSLRSELKSHGIKVTNILPGYIKTNISINAFGANAGQKYGETDVNIENGMDPAIFAQESVKAIFNGENQATVSKLFHKIAPILRNLCPDLFFLGMQYNKKNQQYAVQEPKKKQ